MKEIYEKPEIELISFNPTDSIANADLQLPNVSGGVEEW